MTSSARVTNAIHLIPHPTVAFQREGMENVPLLFPGKCYRTTTYDNRYSKETRISRNWLIWWYCRYCWLLIVIAKASSQILDSPSLRAFFSVEAIEKINGRQTWSIAASFKVGCLEILTEWSTFCSKLWSTDYPCRIDCKLFQSQPNITDINVIHTVVWSASYI